MRNTYSVPRNNGLAFVAANVVPVNGYGAAATTASRRSSASPRGERERQQSRGAVI